ncbi:hypothetical protein BCON_0025g00670 [Botryotinia convoluta]|uniref:Uncharacterized protein n=1 Tax=Botryotinia convoluta TaxID=54673 RepID=A0A4Z1IJ96_9HELO|nr:hypothetical protein BCON_0025g00670 [Botryotinia convoluta]
MFKYNTSPITINHVGFSEKAHEKRKAGGENPASNLKPSNISKKTKIDSSEKIFSTEEGASPMNSEKTIIGLTTEHSASPFTCSLVSELAFEEFDEETRGEFDEYREYDYDFNDRSKYEFSDDEDDEHFGPKRMEAKTKVHFLKGKTARCVLSIYVTKGEDNRWLDNICVECFYKGDLVGDAFGRYIHRQGIKSNFLNMMELTSYKMGEIAGELFNKFGYLLRNFKEHAQADRFRRLHVIAKPDWILDDLSEETYGKSKRETRAINSRALDSAIAFYRSLGFRRIGSSSYLGFSVDPKHKVHSINVDADYDPPRVDEELEISDDEIIVATSSFHSVNEVAQKRLAQLKQRFPLQHAINTLSDAELVAFFKSFDNKNGCAWKVYATKWLIKNIDPQQELALARNIEGLTPLEALQDEFDVSDGVHNLKTLSATYNDVDDDDLKAALAMTIAYTKENFGKRRNAQMTTSSEWSIDNAVGTCPGKAGSRKWDALT